MGVQGRQNVHVKKSSLVALVLSEEEAIEQIVDQ